MLYPDLKGKTALITGAGRPTGIGFSIARSLAASGMDCILADLPGDETGDSLHGCVAALRRECGTRAWPLELDLSAPDGPLCVEQSVDRVRRLAPGLRVLVNNAGVMPPPAPLGEAEPERWRAVMEVNLFGPFRMVRAFLPLLADGGVIINMASRAGKRPLPQRSAYSVSKAALIMLTKCLAVEYGPRGLRANAICPGQILTDLNRRRYAQEASALKIPPEKRMRQIAGDIPSSRLGYPEDVAGLTAFLASEASSFITGQAFNVCGGQLVEA